MSAFRTAQTSIIATGNNYEKNIRSIICLAADRQ